MKESVYLQPGQIGAFAEPFTLWTVLGSCIAVCLWDRRLRVGGMNHFLLPEAPQSERSFRYGGPAIDELVARVRALGSVNGGLTAQVIGGACVLEAFRSRDHVGVRNAEVARERLAALGVPIVMEDVGGSRGRRLRFSLEDGSVGIRVL